jgi:hypothetical protein
MKYAGYPHRSHSCYILQGQEEHREIFILPQKMHKNNSPSRQDFAVEKGFFLGRIGDHSKAKRKKGKYDIPGFRGNQTISGNRYA